MANERMSAVIDGDVVMELTEAALRRLVAGRARKKDDSASCLDNLPNLAWLWQDGYKGSDDPFIAGINGDVYNECFLVAADILQRKHFTYRGQAVKYLALAFTKVVFRQFYGRSTAIELPTPQSLSVAGELGEEEEVTLEKPVEEVGFSSVELASVIRESFTAKQIEILAMLAAGYTRQEIIRAGVAANATINKVKKKLHHLLRSA